VFLFVIGLVLADNGSEEPALIVRTAEVVTRAADPRPVDDRAIDVPAPTPELLAGAEFGDQQALETLLEIPPQKRSRELWLVLAKGRMAQKRTEAAMVLLREAVELNAEFANDAELTQLVRQGANDPDSSKIALATAAEVLGSRGTDILFSVWADTKRRTPTTALAEHYLQQAEVVEHASPALKVALKLRDDLDCESTRSLLEDVQRVGDTRALNPLAKLRSKRGCGPGKRSDCYTCLREDELLESAISASAQRPGPKY
jgi:hypothetical protein